MYSPSVPYRHKKSSQFLYELYSAIVSRLRWYFIFSVDFFRKIYASIYFLLRVDFFELRQNIWTRFLSTVELPEVDIFYRCFFSFFDRVESNFFAYRSRRIDFIDRARSTFLTVDIIVVLRLLSCWLGWKNFNVTIEFSTRVHSESGMTSFQHTQVSWVPDLRESFTSTSFSML